VPRPYWQSSLRQSLQLNHKTPRLALAIAEESVTFGSKNRRTFHTLPVVFIPPNWGV
jgi:hypothetical protein